MKEQPGQQFCHQRAAESVQIVLSFSLIVFEVCKEDAFHLKNVKQLTSLEFTHISKSCI